MKSRRISGHPQPADNHNLLSEKKCGEDQGQPYGAASAGVPLDGSESERKHFNDKMLVKRVRDSLTRGTANGRNPTCNPEQEQQAPYRWFEYNRAQRQVREKPHDAVKHMPPTVAKPVRYWFSLTLRTSLVVVSLAAGSFGQGQQPGIQEQLTIQDPAQLVGKKINVNRLPLCEPGTYKPDLVHAGMEATVVSAKPSKILVLSKSILDKLSPDMRDLMLDQQKAALLLLKFDDGSIRDTCAALGPKKLSEYIELVPGETLEPVAPVADANVPASKSGTQTIGEISDEEVNSALSGHGKDHWVRIDDMGLMAAQGVQAPSVTLFLPDALLAMRSESSRKQFLKYEPTQEDRQNALTVVAEGFVAETVQGGCSSITRIILLSEPSGNVVKEAYFSEPLGETWRNAYGASNYCQALRAKFSIEDVQQVRAAAQDHEFYIAVFSGSTMTKMYRVKHKHQSKLGLK